MGCGCDTQNSGSNGDTGVFRVELPPIVWAGESFSIRVTASGSPVQAQAVSYSAGTLTLDDASQFAGSGDGSIASGDTSISFQWGGVSGNDLTGVTGITSVTEGDTVTSLSQPLADYSGVAAITASAIDNETGELQELTISPGFIQGDDWINGAAGVLINISDTPISADMELTITVLDTSTPSTGRTGSGNAEWETKTGYLRVIIPPLITSGSSFTLKVTAYDDNNDIISGYNENCNITVDSGSLSITTITSGWSGGKVTVTGEVYTNTNNVPVEFTVTSSDGTMTGSATAIANTHTAISAYTGETAWFQRGNDFDDDSAEDAWDGSFADCLDFDPTSDFNGETGQYGTLGGSGEDWSSQYFKIRSVYLFDVSGHVGDADYAALYMSNAAIDLTFDGSEVIEEFDSTFQIYAVLDADLDDPPGWDDWDSAILLRTMLRSQLAPDTDATGSDFFDNVIEIDSDLINSVESGYFAIFVVSVDEILDTQVPFPGEPPIGATYTQEQRLKISGATLYLQ